MSFFIAFQEKSNGLNAARHKGTAKIGLDCSGRLLPGFLFDGYGNVVPSLNPDAKPRKPKKRLSNSCLDECNPCDEKIVVLKKPIEKTVKKIVIRANPNVNKETLAKAMSATKIIKEKFKNIEINDIQNVKITDIFTDEKRFQNRNKLDQRIVNNIVKNFDATQFDPIIIWKDAKLNKYFVLAGHHRFEAIKQLGDKTIQAKIAIYTEKEAVEFAKEKSNANRTLELPQERAKIYRAHIVGDNLSKKELLEFAKTNEGKNANYIVNLAYLNPKGITIQALDQLSETPDKQNATIIEKIADWIGEARKQFDGKLDNTNETEMFKFLQDKNQSLRIKTKAEFLQKITATIDAFWKLGDVLNLARFSNKTEGENVYEAEYKDLQKQLEIAIENKQNLIERIKNPKHHDFIKPTDKNYKSIIVALEKAIEKYNEQIKSLQTKIIVLSRKKGNYINSGSNQVGLFGVIPEFKTVKELCFYAYNWAIKFLENKTYFHKEINENVKFTKQGIKHCLNSNQSKIKTLLIFKSYSLLKKSKLIEFQVDKKSRSQIDGVYLMKTFLKIKGIKYDVILTLRKGQNGVVYYDHKSSQIKKATTTVQGLNPETVVNDNFSKNKDNKNNTKKPNSELNIVHEAKIIEPEQKDNRITLANKFKNCSTINEFFKIYCNQLARFIGQIEIKPTFSVVITLTGDEGSGKTRMCFQMMNAFAQYNKVGHASMEEQPDSNLYLSKQNDYLNQTAIENIESPEINSLNDLHNMILRNDVIVIDSYTKMKEINQGFEVDKDLRKKYNGKLFIVIFQQTTTGAMRGGSKSQFDADVVIFTQKFDDNYKKNYIYATKNRYNKEIGLEYNIFNRALQGVTTVMKPQKFIENAQQILLEAPKQQILKYKVD